MSERNCDVDSPFHHALEIQRDNIIREFKQKFSAFLLEKLYTIEGVREVEYHHTEESWLISFHMKICEYNVRVNYNIHSKMFGEPYTTLDNMMFPLNNCNSTTMQISSACGHLSVDTYKMRGLYGKHNPVLTNGFITAMEYCYEVNQLKGMGNYHGCSWMAPPSPRTLALREFERLME